MNDNSYRYKKYGVFIVDEKGLAVRCFNARKAAVGWIEKHWPDLPSAEKRKRIWTFSSYPQVKRFFDRQITLGCTDSEILSLMTYYCGVSTAVGFDLKNGRSGRLNGTK